MFFAFFATPGSSCPSVQRCCLISWSWAHYCASDFPPRGTVTVSFDFFLFRWTVVPQTSEVSAPKLQHSCHPRQTSSASLWHCTCLNAWVMAIFPVLPLDCTSDQDFSPDFQHPENRSRQRLTVEQMKFASMLWVHGQNNFQWVSTHSRFVGLRIFLSHGDRSCRHRTVG